MESYQQQLKEQQAKLQKAAKQAQEAAGKATAQQQVSVLSVCIPCCTAIVTPGCCCPLHCIGKSLVRSSFHLFKLPPELHHQVIQNVTNMAADPLQGFY